MQIDLNLIREILKELYTVSSSEEATYLSETFALSPPSLEGYKNESNLILDHIDLLELCGLLRRTNQIKMRNHPDPVTIEPTSETRKWAYAALDDDKWAETSPELKKMLDACQSQSNA